MNQLKYLGCLLLSVICTLSFAQTPPPNNPIFGGGYADGWAFNGMTQAGNPIYNGGHGDGWDMSGYALQTGNNIYSGGNGDGWSMGSYAEMANNIYNGGQGDGWASVFRPLGPLPVTLFSFAAEKKQEVVKIKWATASEQNTGWFEIERSTDAGNFVLIGKVEAVGNSATNREYTFTDEHPEVGNNFYRLKMVDMDGVAAYSSVVLVKFDGENSQIIAFPNPVREWVNLRLSKNYDKDIPAYFYDVSGRLVYQGRIPAGVNQYKFNIGHLPSGSYLIRLILPERDATIKIVK